MSNTAPTIDSLRQYICQELLNNEALQLEDDKDLLMTGLLDSLNVIRLAGHIEESGGFQIPPEDVIMEHFGSLKQIMEYVQTRT